MLCDIILILLIWIAISIIILFVDFSGKEKENNYDVSIYKTYYLYDQNSEPVSLTYDMIELKKESSFDEIITAMFQQFQEHLNADLELLGYEKNEDTLSLKLNQDISQDKITLDSIVNSFTNIYGIQTVKIIYGESEKKYQSNLDEYYINSPLQNKLLTFLYKDSNYRLLYKNQEEATIDVNIKKIVDERTVYLSYENAETKWNIKTDGLYIDNQRILTSTYKVGDTFESDGKTVQVLKVVLDEDDILNITIKRTSIEEEIFVLKQGIGLYAYEKKDNNNELLETYKFYKRKIVKVN